MNKIIEVGREVRIMAVKKYEFTGKTRVFNKHIVREIRAINDFYAGETFIEKGTVGGYIESEKNLPNKLESAFGVYHGSWVSGLAVVMDNAKVLDDAYVYEAAVVKDNAIVNGNALVRGVATVGGHALVGYDPRYEDDYAASQSTPLVFDRASIMDHAIVMGDYPSVAGRAIIRGHAIVNGDSSYIGGNTELAGNVYVQNRCSMFDGKYTKGEYNGSFEQPLVLFSNKEDGFDKLADAQKQLVQTIMVWAGSTNSDIAFDYKKEDSQKEFVSFCKKAYKQGYRLPSWFYNHSKELKVSLKPKEVVKGKVNENEL